MTSVLLTCAGLAGIGYWLTLLSAPHSLLRALVKTLPVALIALTSWLAGGAWLLTIALVLSAAGDWFLAFKGERAFLAGLVSFLVAHLVYCVLFFAGQDEAWAAGPWFLAGTVIIFAIALGIYRRLRNRLGPMKLPVAIYTAAIAAMAVAALSRGPDPVLISGAVLFMASDMVLAHEVFVLDEDSPARRITSPFIWLSYLAAQVLIAAAFLL
ncbi:MAG: lysoplasmalogenase [Nitratireductor sp.]